jgi:hypothetical protein
VLIGERVRVRRGGELRRRGDRQRVERNRQTGTVRQVWRGDRQALVLLDRDGLGYVVRLRDLRPDGRTT